MWLLACGSKVFHLGLVENFARRAKISTRKKDRSTALP
jgi:hypothetical protein